MHAAYSALISCAEASALIAAFTACLALLVLLTIPQMIV